MSYILTFLEGVVSFLSPCLLPLLPVYVAYFAGGAGPEEERDVRKTLLSAACFVLGFTVLFVAMGAFAGTVGAWLVRYRRVIDIACGVALVALGLNYMGVLRLSILNRVGSSSKATPRGLLNAFVFGMAFAVCWTPCVGAFLASALSLAASSANMLAGTGLLACFSLGLGVPFVLSAVLIDQLGGAFVWVKQHYTTINTVCGLLLILEGIAMASGILGNWMALLT